MPRVTILPDQKMIEVPAGTSLLEAAQRAGAMLGSACGGNCACHSCHVWVRAGSDSLSEAEDRELDQLDSAFDVKPESRLACQAQVTNEDVVAEVTPESLQTWLDEHPDERRAIEGGQLPAGTSPELAERLQKHMRGGTR